MAKRNFTEIIIGVLAVFSIILVAVESLADVSEGMLRAIYIVDGVICCVFAWDFIFRLKASESKMHFLKTSGFEILAMIPAVAFYALGAIPAISTGFRSLRLVRVVIVFARMRRVMMRSGGFLKRSNLIAMIGITTGIIFLGAFAVLVLETGTEGARITNLADAVWWTISTITTVGYGDVVPHSMAGRIMGMVLMVVGIGVMAALISQVSAALVEKRLKKEPEKDDFRTSVVSQIKEKLDRIDELSESEVQLLTDMIRTLRVKGGD
ncbi:MAG: potassium channel family protein [Dehalococcoidales bacterium]|nr:potassium channel family protein [Dehalococcoidales bacterium]